MFTNKKNKIINKAIACIVCFFVCIYCLPLTSFAFVAPTSTVQIGYVKIPAVTVNGQQYVSLNYLTTTIDGIRYVRKENMDVAQRVKDYIEEKYEKAIKELKKQEKNGAKYEEADPSVAYEQEYQKHANDKDKDGSLMYPNIATYLKKTKQLENQGGKWVAVGYTQTKAVIIGHDPLIDAPLGGPYPEVGYDNFSYTLTWEGAAATAHGGASKTYTKDIPVPTKAEYSDAKGFDQNNPDWHKVNFVQETTTVSRTYWDADVMDENGNKVGGQVTDVQTVYKPTQEETLDKVLQEADGQMIVPECLPAVLYDCGQVGTVEGYGQDGKRIDYAYPEYDRKKAENDINYKGDGTQMDFPAQFYFNPDPPKDPVPINDMYYQCDASKVDDKGVNCHKKWDEAIVNGAHYLINGAIFVHITREVCTNTEYAADGVTVVKVAGKEYKVDKIYTLDGTYMPNLKPSDGVPVHAAMKYYYDVEYYSNGNRPDAFYKANWNLGIDWKYLLLSLDESTELQGNVHHENYGAYWTYIDPETGEETTRYGRAYIYNDGDLAKRTMTFECPATTISNPTGAPTSLPAMEVKFWITDQNGAAMSGDDVANAVVHYSITYKTIEDSSKDRKVPADPAGIAIDRTEKIADPSQVKYTPSPELEFYYASGFNIEEYVYKAVDDWDVWETNYPGALDTSNMPIIAINTANAAQSLADNQSAMNSMIYKMRYSGWEKMKSTIMNMLIKPWETFNTSSIQLFIGTLQNLAFALLILYFLIELIGKILAFDFSLDALIGALVKLLIARLVIQIAPQLCEIIYRISIEYAKIVWNSSGSGIFEFANLPKMTVENLFGSQMGPVLQKFSYILTGTAPVLAILYPIFGMIFIGVILLIPIFINGVVVIIGWFQLLQLYIRYIEIMILYTFSPLAAASFVSGEFKHIGKSFMLNFGAICLQSSMIILGMRVIDGLIEVPTAGGSSTVIDFIVTWLDPLGGIVNSLLPAIIMTMLIGKSRAFAKTILGE